MGTISRRGVNFALTDRLGLGSLQSKLLDPVANLVAIHAQQRRGLGLVPAGALERLDDERALELLEIDAAGRQLDAIPQAAAPRASPRSPDA